MNKDKKKQEQSEEKNRTFRWLFSVVGEILLIIPILIVLLLFAHLIQGRGENNQEASSVTSWIASGEEYTNDRQLTMGFYDSVYEDGTGWI